jgi:hypothetical protein
MVRKFLAVALVFGIVSPVAAGPVSVYTQVRDVGGTGNELRLSGLGTLASLPSGDGINPVVTVPADQTSAGALVVGFWPVVVFSDMAQYEAQRGTLITIPETPVTLYAEVWNGVYGSNPPDVRQVLIDAVISGTFGTELGQNSLDWRFVNPPPQVDFGDTLVTLEYAAIKMPDGIPSIGFEDGSPGIGFPGNDIPYYPTLLEARVSVERDPTDPTDPGPTDPPPGGQPGGTPGVPEPASALLLAGLAVGGFAARSRAARKSGSR